MTMSVASCLTFTDRAEEAITFYVSLFPGARVLSIQRSESDGPIPKGKVMHAEFELDGQRYTAFDGGEHFRFSDAFSFVITCDTQSEIDRLWAALTANGGAEVQCGWLTDRFGVSWQVVPAVLGRLLSDASAGDPRRAAEAMMGMVKLDIAALEAAYRGGPAPAR